MKKSMMQNMAVMYANALYSRGFAKEKIRHYGFVFMGKEVLIGSDSE